MCVFNFGSPYICNPVVDRHGRISVDNAKTGETLALSRFTQYVPAYTLT